MKEDRSGELLENALIQGGQTDAEGRLILNGKESTEARSNSVTATRWNFPLVMNIRMVRFLWSAQEGQHL